MSYQANGADLQRTESYTWPAAHVGHLNESQQTQLDKFRRLCESKGYYTPATEDTPATHDDETLLRYLRARKFNPEQAFDQLKDTEDWRKANDLDNLYETIDIDEYEQTRRLYPQWTGRRDKRGIPFYVYEIGQVDAKAVSAYSSDRDNSSKSKSSTTNTTSPQTPRKMLRLFALYENLCRFVLPLCSLVPDRSHSETPISQSSNVVDLSNVGITKFWSLRNHMSDASQLATAHYPETLDRIFVVGAPSFFPTVWEYAKRWFDPITVSKIFILSEKNMRSTLEQYVDLDNLPKKYGGNLDWEFGDMPALDPGIVKALDWKETIEQKGHKTLPIGPIRWEYEDESGKKGDLVAKAIGTEKGKPRRNVIAGLHPEAGLARLALSPGRQSVPGNKSQSISNGGGSRAASATAASVQSATPVAAAASSSLPSQDRSTTPTTTSETKGSTEGKKMNAPADYMNPVEGEEGGSQTTNTRTAGEGEGKNTYLDYSGLGAGTAAAAGAGAGAAGAAGTTAAETSNPTSTSTDPNASVPTNTTTTSTSPPAPQQETRQGTSSTRYAQQEGTHAAGQLASGAPETRVDSQGEKQGIMEPGTVGQAPKKHPMRDELGEEMKGGEGKGGSGGSSGVMGQASSYANSAVQGAKSGAGAVMGAVGIGGAGKSKEEEERRKEEEEAEKERERRRDDPEVEKLDGRNVEEFLRSKTASAAEPMKR
ncbi:CRAL/TRIO domain-containing protein [Hortaea werneckii]|nr:CRAL/TRIO domain-containing protein [Hortaea werneckii]KAI7098632.1 CRAL/TRIO domain-containing protein [Hortaea werneckii]KAI7204493.1 CRAL/TRIO domain-containing protein [Hortaea werneckii]KAI7296764.1 CRAL/TRIO domain-containing protein [Hortaea werneckii]